MKGKRTSIFIKNCLMEKEESYIQELWREYRSYCLKNGYRPPSRQSFGSYIWVLKKLGLIEFVRKERGLKGTVRHYYRINPDKIDDKGWEDPVKALGLRK